VEILLPDAEEVTAADERLRHHGLQTANDGQSVVVSDPWDNTILLRPTA
jgi:catechol 2,3-dioxygenase